MAEVNITINGRSFGISCEDGQEQRVLDLSHYVDSRMKDISKAGAASSEAHLMVLTTLLLADEVFDLRNDVGSMSENLQSAQANQNEEAAVAGAIEDLASRIDRIASRIQNA
ncbi:MAG TPA: cell division protein ZapA [Alphaproteobacteria bacterium]|nr:cell division protein ZapA [Alphaproteobacteria bacterium]USO06265.1 MAG: cell division protein ZapA [Rhodospirillales bacterium]HOO81469.1 cell division protein ZapA [Alphaproteobacteria bacterium]